MPFFEESVTLARQRGPRWTVYISLFALGDAARVLGDFSQADVLLNESFSVANAAGERFGACLALNALSLSSLNQGQMDEGRRLALESLTRSLELGDTRQSAVSLEALGCVAAAEGKARRAARLFGAAQGLYAPVGDLVHSTVRGDRERGMAIARAQLGEAGFARELGNGRAMSLRDAASYATADPDAIGPIPDGLTPRELDVLALLAQRRSNREIAEALVLSVRTVERHITNIYGKTGITNRPWRWVPWGCSRRRSWRQLQRSR